MFEVVFAEFASIGKLKYLKWSIILNPEKLAAKMNYKHLFGKFYWG